jgi:hypothetical protein
MDRYQAVIARAVQDHHPYVTGIEFDADGEHIYLVFADADVTLRYRLGQDGKRWRVG